MKSKSTNAVEKKQCTVCLERFVNASLDQCSHQFCIRCIKKWSKKHNTCPLCREPYRQIKYKEQIINVSAPPAPQRLTRLQPQVNPQQPQGRIMFLPIMNNLQPFNFTSNFHYIPYPTYSPMFSPATFNFYPQMYQSTVPLGILPEAESNNLSQEIS